MLFGAGGRAPRMLKEQLLVAEVTFADPQAAVHR